MPISEIAAWVVHVPLLTEWLSSPEFGSHQPGPAPVTLIRLTDCDGFQGWAEASGDVLDTLDTVSARLIGAEYSGVCLTQMDLRQPEEIYWQRPGKNSPYHADPADMRHRLRHSLQSPIEAAMTDLMARRSGVSVCQFFGGRWRDAVPSDYWAGRVTPEQAGKCALRAQELGFHGIKLKATLEDPNVERLEAIRATAGADFRVTVDPNGRFYRLDDAWETLRAMERVGNLRMIEDPFPRFRLDEFAALRSRTAVRIVVHIDPIESLWQVIRSGAASGLNVESRVGGPFHWRIQAGVAEEAGLLVWHSGGFDLGIGTAWHLQLSASAPNCRLPGDQVGPWMREHSLVKQSFRIEGGCIRVPDGPGIGVEIDLNALDRYCTRNRCWKADDLGNQ